MNLIRALGWTIVVWSAGYVAVLAFVITTRSSPFGTQWIGIILSVVLASSIAAWRHFSMDFLAWFMLIFLGPFGCWMGLWRGANRRDKARALAFVTSQPSITPA